MTAQEVYNRMQREKMFFGKIEIIIIATDYAKKNPSTIINKRFLTLLKQKNAKNLYGVSLLVIAEKIGWIK